MCSSMSNCSGLSSWEPVNKTYQQKGICYKLEVSGLNDSVRSNVPYSVIILLLRGSGACKFSPQEYRKFVNWGFLVTIAKTAEHSKWLRLSLMLIINAALKLTLSIILHFSSITDPFEYLTGFFFYHIWYAAVDNSSLWIFYIFESFYYCYIEKVRCFAIFCVYFVKFMEGSGIFPLDK